MTKPLSKKVLITPIGQFHHRLGEQNISMKTIFNLYRQLRAKKRDIIVDYEHDSLTPGKKAIAAGWIKSKTLAIRPDGLYGVIDWTKDALKLINEKKYRFLSPVFEMRSKIITALYSLGLTNNPNIDAMPPLTNQKEKEIDMSNDLKIELKKVLGLEGDAADSLAVELFNTTFNNESNNETLKNETEHLDINKVRSTLAEKLGIKESFTVEELLDAITKLTDTSRQIEKDQKAMIVENAIANGTLPEQLRSWASQLPSNEITELKKIVPNSKPAVPVGLLNLGTGYSQTVNPLTLNQTRVCSSLGISSEDYIKYND